MRRTCRSLRRCISGRSRSSRQRLRAAIAVIEKGRGATVRVTAPNGTNFTCKIPQNAHMHRNTGEATREKTRDARSVRDREEELPAARTKHH